MSRRVKFVQQEHECRVKTCWKGAHECARIAGLGNAYAPHGHGHAHERSDRFCINRQVGISWCR